VHSVCVFCADSPKVLFKGKFSPPNPVRSIERRRLVVRLLFSSGAMAASKTKIQRQKTSSRCPTAEVEAFPEACAEDSAEKAQKKSADLRGERSREKTRKNPHNAASSDAKRSCAASGTAGPATPYGGRAQAAVSCLAQGAGGEKMRAAMLSQQAEQAA
jgi:hypothetical protein